MGSSFEDLEVWKKSCRLSVRLYELLRDCRDYGMKDQMLRSSLSIPSNIETFEEHPILAKYKEGDNFKRRNTLSISSIEI